MGREGGLNACGDASRPRGRLTWPCPSAMSHPKIMWSSHRGHNDCLSPPSDEVPLIRNRPKGPRKVRLTRQGYQGSDVARCGEKGRSVDPPPPPLIGLRGLTGY